MSYYFRDSGYPGEDYLIVTKKGKEEGRATLYQNTFTLPCFIICHNEIPTRAITTNPRKTISRLNNLDS